MDCEPDGLTILVTGATGFLGTAIVRQLNKTSCRMRTSGRRMPPVDLPNYTAADICNRSAVSRLVAGTDVIIHAAGLAHQHRALASDSDRFFDANVSGTECVVGAAAAAGCRRFVYVSSVSVYGAGWPAKTEEAICVPKGAYGQSKFEGEQKVVEIATSAGMELIILRMATLYGENDPGNVGRLLRLIDRRRFVWVGRGENRKSLIHVDDAARACVLAASTRDLEPGSKYNISSEARTMREIISILAAALGRHEPTLRLSPTLALFAGTVAAKLPGMALQAQRIHSSLEKWLSDEVYDGAKFRKTCSWRPEITLEEGLARQVASYRRAITGSASALELNNGGSRIIRKSAA